MWKKSTHAQDNFVVLDGQRSDTLGRWISLSWLCLLYYNNPKGTDLYADSIQSHDDKMTELGHHNICTPRLLAAPIIIYNMK